ncbi:MAG: carboxypeptidase regulatory-like domain-containing protein, partial [Planctomycetota bacterium]
QQLMTDNEGRFEIPGQQEAFQLVITHAKGFAHLKSSDGPVPNPIQLTPWARAEGNFRVGSELVPGVELQLFSNGIHSYGSGVPHIYTHTRTTTDDEGGYAFDRVFPGRGRIGRHILFMVNDGATEVSSSSRVPAEFVAGRTTKLDLGGSGRTVVGKLMPPEGHQGQVLWNFALVTLEADLVKPVAPKVPESIAKDKAKRIAWWTQWQEAPSGQDWSQAAKQWEDDRAAAPYLTASVDRDGSFQLDDVPPGDYVLQVRERPQVPGTLAMPVSVPDLQDQNVAGPPVELGPRRLVTVSEVGQPADTKPNPDEVSSDVFQGIRVRILDEDGKPIPGAKLFANLMQPSSEGKGTIDNRHLVADPAGVILLPMDRQKDTVKLWAGKEGYVPEFVWLRQTDSTRQPAIPESFEFRLAAGTRIAGTVVDDNDTPISGVRVRVMLDWEPPGHGSVEGVPRIDSWLSDGNSRPDLMTDDQGRWELTNAPSATSKLKLRFKFIHPDYTGDQQWGELQRTQGVGDGAFRRGDAKIVMASGQSIQGQVTDTQDNPITKGWVVWNDLPYFTDGTWESELNSKGEFRTSRLPPGTYPVTIIAPGYAAQRRMVDVGPNLTQLQFKLKAGKRIRIRFVDKIGNPIPKAFVQLANTSVPSTWNGSNALHNHRHSNVPNYGIPRRTADDGVFQWDWAPEEPVTYSFGAKGFASQKVSLVAKEEPHVITLAEARVVFGGATDATTGEAIEDFRVMPVIVFRPNFFGTRFENTQQGVDGRYSLPLTGSADPNSRYRVRCEADGYRSVVSAESFGPDDGRVEWNVQLDPAPIRQGLVIDADGIPVADAMVMGATPTFMPRTVNGEPNGNGEPLVRTDSDGRFELNATSETVRLRVLHGKGVAEKRLDPMDESIGTLQLQAWAGIDGRLTQEGQPMADQFITFQPWTRPDRSDPPFQDSYWARTSPDGTFSFQRLPPGPGNVQASLGPWQVSPLTSAQSIALTLKPGEQRSITLGGEGAVITGQVVATGRETTPLDHHWSLNYLIRRAPSKAPTLPMGFPTLSFDPTAPMQPSWTRDPNFASWMAMRENHFVKLTQDGQFRVTGVSPGAYDLVIRLFEQPAGCLVETIGERVIPVEMDDNGTLDLGRVEIPCRVGPRVGSDMRAYRILDSTGREMAIADISGQYVVLHVWASWCAPCLASMPAIANSMEQLDGKPITFVGLNVDADGNKARDLVEQRRWTWAQNYLGDDSPMTRQLAISSVPSYYFVGPDGRLIASGNEWGPLQKTILETVVTDSTHR